MPTATNVSVGKPRVGGGVYVAPIGTELPTDAVSPLAEAFKNLGYVSDNGVTNSNNANRSEIGSWGGDVVCEPQSTKNDKFKMMLIESLNIDVLKTVYGSDNVSGDLNTGIHVKVNSSERPPLAWVIDTIMTGGVLKRMVIPNGTITELGDIVYKNNEPIGYDISVSGAPDSGGDTHHEYLKGANPAE